MAQTKNSPIEIDVESSSPEKVKAGVLVVGAFPDGTLLRSSQKIDEASKGKLSAVIKRGDLEEKPGATLLLHDLPGVQAERVLVVSLGKRDKFDEKAFRAAVSGAAKILASSPAKDAAVTLSADVPDRSLAWRAQTASRILADAAYRFDAPGKSAKKERGARKITLLVSDKVTDELKNAVRQGQAVAEGMALAKDLGNLPGNICHPGYLADTARALGKEFNLDVEVLEREDMQKTRDGSSVVGRTGVGAAVQVHRHAVPRWREKEADCTDWQGGDL